MEIKSNFSNLIKTKSLAQGYIFWGDVEAGEDLAWWLANNLENCPKVLVDASFLDPVDGSISIDKVREAAAFLWQKPLTALKKTLIIRKAYQMTAQAQNALLKIAEEPPPHGLVILTVKNLENLLPTLLSRFQKIKMAVGSALGDQALAAEAINFLKVSSREKAQIIKGVLEEGDEYLAAFVKAVMSELDKDPVKNLLPLRALLTRWTNICQYNTNKRLQLEAWIQCYNLDHDLLHLRSRKSNQEI